MLALSRKRKLYSSNGKKAFKNWTIIGRDIAKSMNTTQEAMQYLELEAFWRLNCVTFEIRFF